MGRKVWFPVVSGPLEPFAAGFALWLASRAYSPSAAADRLCQFDQLSRWLERERLGVGELTVEQAERFVAERRGAGRVTWVAPQSVALPLGYLRDWGWCRRQRRLCHKGRLRSCWRSTAGICWSSADSRSTRWVMRLGRPRGCSWPGGRVRTGSGSSGCPRPT